MKNTSKLVLNQETLKNLTERHFVASEPLTSNNTGAQPCCVCAPDLTTANIN